MSIRFQGEMVSFPNLKVSAANRPGELFLDSPLVNKCESFVQRVQFVQTTDGLIFRCWGEGSNKAGEWVNAKETEGKVLIEHKTIRIVFFTTLINTITDTTNKTFSMAKLIFLALRERFSVA